MFSFVILHYKTINDTLECLESIKKIKTKRKVSIIIVDNNSLTKDDKKILNKYTKDIILLEENIGFAKANNIGASYAKEHYNPDFIAVINNDTIIEQEDFIDLIYNVDKEYHFDMLGPKILPEETESVNPFPVLKTLDAVKKRIIYTEKLIKIYSSSFLNSLLTFYIKTKRIFKKPIKNGNSKIIEIDVALHGCAIIFSKKYYSKFEHVFYNETFLFHEEEFLYQRVKKNNLISIYHPNIEIIHKEGQSTKKDIKDSRKRLLFRNKKILDSLKKLEKVMQEGREI